ncbi:MAG: Holliday junction resolvase RuvX [Chloroflexi bacterium]|nr:Holliday junction resolvase RuvX [Chloroflexota bacterium]
MTTPPGRILAIDHGTKRIGVAMSDELGMLATPLCILQPRAADRAEAVAALVREHSAVEILVGYPRTLRGEAGPQARRVERFVQALQAVVNAPVRLWDEGYSTAEATARMAAGRKPSAGRQQPRRQQPIHVDAVAAAVLLQEYLDWRRSSSSSSR